MKSRGVQKAFPSALRVATPMAASECPRKRSGLDWLPDDECCGLTAGILAPPLGTLEPSPIRMSLPHDVRMSSIVLPTTRGHSSRSAFKGALRQNLRSLS
jgi:hypothetical protein